MADRRLVGKYVERAGQLLFWAGLGSVVGYWASDRGVRWLPDFVGGVLVLALLSLGAIVLGRVMMGKAIDVQSRRVSIRAAVAIGLTAVAAGGRLAVFWMAVPSPLTELDKSDLQTVFAEDTLHYGELDRGMASAVEGLGGILPDNRSAVVNADGEQALLDLWRTLAIGGRQTLPANEIARSYAQAYGTDHESFDFVLFYDADERAHVSRSSNESAFRDSWKRSRWEIVVGESTL